ncbi:putative WD repeat-containing protein C32H8.09 [Erysiphe neolycopersici]|uniref:Putative WD repeat-containing protein C32H8.09 n=1 Tax=Erysiphe neolycopersici TaxID=212602 RepID=A0A420HHH7_9PEZI|nr:putative WD repeat-containing protein C32H8.09 [Erysiphe neolycopersici]
MLKSQIVKSSSRSLPSPNGAFIAIILPTSLCIRETCSLEVLHEVPLPSEIVVSWFLWSPSSSRILIGTKETFYIFSPTITQVFASIKNVISYSVKASLVTFGLNDNEILVFYDLSLKLTIININTSESVDIPSIKLYSPTTASRGFCYRPSTGNLTLLSRNGGKDVISLHARGTQEIFRSWYLETIDAQGLSWSADGKWLAIYDSASQGFKLLIYTAEGHLYKKWQASTEMQDIDPYVEFGLGIKMVEWSPNGKHVAIGDYSDRVTLLQTPHFTHFMSFSHQTILKTKDFNIVWQEQIDFQESGSQSVFIQINKDISLPTSSNATKKVKTGVSLVSFDKSGSRLAVKMEETPTTIWIWDVMKPVPKAILVLHATVSKILWHPTIEKQLMVLCEDRSAHGLVYLWNDTWLAPKIINFASYLPECRVAEKTYSQWIYTKDLNPCLFFSDSENCLLLWLRESSDPPNRIKDENTRNLGILELNPV